MKFFFTVLLGMACLNIFGQVNLQSGSATFSLPIFNWQDGKSRLNSVVELNYNSGSGLRVNDVASNIGQGWNLLAGGVITRIQAGEPDDQKPHLGTSTETVEDLDKYPAGYLYDTKNADDGCPYALTEYPIFKDKNHLYKPNNAVVADKELDHFAFQFNGRSGVFILDKSDDNIGILLTDSRMIISFTRDETMTSLGIRTTINSFTIQDENGLKYTFSTKELTKVLKTNYCNADLTMRSTQPNFRNSKKYFESQYDNMGIVNPYIVTSWYLTKMEDVLTGRTIDFEYESRHINASAGSSVMYNNGHKKYTIVSNNKTITETQVISAIKYPDYLNDYEVKFNYGTSRVDLEGDQVLASIDVLYQGRYQSKYQLNTNYFIRNRYGTPVTDYDKSRARLCLMSVQKFGVDLKSEDPPFVFDYFLGSGTADDFVPPPFYYAKDIWGFYNGDNSKTYEGSTISPRPYINDLSYNDLKGLCFIRSNVSGVILNPKPGYAKNGLLRQITYPTGGSLNYSYAQNVAYQQSQNTEVGGVHVSATTITDGGYSNDCNNPVTTNYQYSLDASNTQSSLWGVEPPINSIETNTHYMPESKFFNWNLLSPACKFRYQYPGILSREQAPNVTVGQQALVIFSQVANVVGAAMTVKDIVQLAGNATGPGAVIIDLIADVFSIVMTCFINPAKDNTNTLYYNYDLNGSNPLPSQYKKVEITEGSGSNGKTEILFTSPDEYAIWENTNLGFSMKQRYAYDVYGLPKLTTVYDANGNRVKENENIYDFTHAKETLNQSASNYYPSCKCFVKNNSSQKITDWQNSSIYNADASYVTNSTSNADLEAHIYQIYWGYTELATTQERSFKSGSSTEYLETTTNYDYDTWNHQVNKIETIQSNGDKYYKNIKYNNEFSGGPITILNDNKFTSIPVSTSTSVEKNGVTTYLDENVTEFTTTSNGNIKPLRSREQRFNTPVSSSSMVFYHGPGSSSNPSYKETSSFYYDAAGNLAGIKDEGNHTIINLYDYNDKYVVASVVNAEAGLDTCAYSSFETANLGGWTLGASGVATYSDNSSVTGNKILQLSPSNGLTKSLNISKGYILSFWANNSNVSVSNSSMVKSTPTVNSFTYYEYKIAAGNTSVTVSGNANIDELRLYPENSRMRTVTYDPLIGKTSECDENNRITSYEYDAAGRLRFIKDENKNIVKMYEYNTSKKPTGCPATYHNFAVSEVYTKNNCGTGYAGSEVTYTIPESTYTSSISQSAIDEMVNHDLISKGQAYADSIGTCSRIFYSSAISQGFTKEGCEIGTKGTTITYTVNAGIYTSTVSQPEADQMAQDDIDSNGQAIANAADNASCVTDTDPYWVGTGAYSCEMINGSYTGYRLTEVKDENPNSITYNQTQWVNNGETSSICSNSSCASCSGDDRKCISQVCEIAVKVYTTSTYSNGHYYCTYHYKWSDNSTSVDYTEETTGCCAISQ